MKSQVSVFLLCLTAFLCVSCKPDKAHLKVTNHVHNVKLENISYCGFSLGYSLLPGESTKAVLFSDDYDDVSFPMTGSISFYMVRGDKRVLLNTKEHYQLKANQNLEVEITDETEVVNLME